MGVSQAPKQSNHVDRGMIRRKPNIKNKHFDFEQNTEEYTCKSCGSTYSELDAIGHLMEVHGYNHVDIILDEVRDE